MAELPHIRVVTAEIERDGRYLITQRPPKAVLPLLWEFPGGKVEPGESDEAALVRELNERFGLSGVVGELRQEIHHEYARYTLDMLVYRVELDDGEIPHRGKVHDHRWVAPEEFGQFEFPGADRQTVDALLDE